MKKILAIAFLAVLTFSCSKKPDHSLQDSNVMLQEPEAKTIDTTVTAAPVDQGNESALSPETSSEKPATDSTAQK